MAKGPFLCAALLCERMETSEDGVHSLHGLVSNVTASDLPARADFHLFVMVDPGSNRAPFKLLARLLAPSGDNRGEYEADWHFGVHGAAQIINLPFPFPVKEVGVHRLEVSLNGVLEAVLRVNVVLRKPH